MANELTVQQQALASVDPAVALERVLIQSDLSQLTPAERIAYYKERCDRVGLDPLTSPFEYLRLNGKIVLYAKKECTEQLRHRDKISIKIVARELFDDVWVVTAMAKTPDGRMDESIGAVNIEKLKGEVKANAMMKAETKAKRRVTLSICGLGLLDESEVTDEQKHETYSTGETFEQIAARRVAEIQGSGGSSPQAASTVPESDSRGEGRVGYGAQPSDGSAGKPSPSDIQHQDGDVPDQVLKYWSYLSKGKRAEKAQRFEKILSDLYKKIEGTQGSDADYIKILAGFGIGEASDFTLVGEETSCKAILSLYRHYEKVKAALAPPPEEEV